MIAGDFNDVLRNGGSIGKQVIKCVKGLTATSHNVQIAIFTVPEGQDKKARAAMQRADVAAISPEV